MDVSRELRHFGRRHVRRFRQPLGNFRGCRRAPFDKRQITQQFVRWHDQRRHGRQPIERLAATSQCSPANKVISIIRRHRIVRSCYIETLAAARTLLSCRDSRDKFRCAAGFVGGSLSQAAIGLRFRPIDRPVQPSQIDPRSAGFGDGECRRLNAMLSSPGHALRQRVATT